MNKERSDNIKTPVTGQSILMESMIHLNFWILAFVLFIVSRSFLSPAFSSMKNLSESSIAPIVLAVDFKA